MSTHVLRKTRDPLELLERLLNETSLTTKRVAHGNIIDVGGKALELINKELSDEKEAAVREAVEAAEARATRELRAATKRLRRSLEEDKKVSMQKQKQYYEDLIKRIAEQRDRLEEERIRELKLLHEKALAEALQKQWEECERLKEVAIQEACTALTKRLRNEFVLEKEKAIADALAIAREKFKKREKESIERTRRQCEQEAAEEAARVAELHKEEIQQHVFRYNILYLKYQKELHHKMRVEKDFKDLQTDYQRFMDYTDGKYHSDYMMHLRKHGQQLAAKRISVVTYENIEELPNK